MTATLRTVLILLVGVFLTQGVQPLVAQNGAIPNAGVSQVPRSGQQEHPVDPALQNMEERRAREANKQRQQQLQRDADRLLQLATELKLYVDKTNENVLSLNVIKKADEIEKLAHSVKDKMKAN